MRKLNINSDVGEGILYEEKLMSYLRSCSVACGGHFGDTNTMKESVGHAIKNRVLIGAHPSYPDRLNFGRRSMSITSDDLKKSLLTQINSLKRVMNSFGLTKLDHIKAHGALYNECVVDFDIATLYVEVVKSFVDVKIYAPYGSVVAEVAKQNGVSVDYEVFLDRNYENDHTLVSRLMSNSMLIDPNEMIYRYKMVNMDLKIKTIHNKLIDTVGDTFCIHSDTKDSHLHLENFYKNYFSNE